MSGLGCDSGPGLGLGINGYVWDKWGLVWWVLFSFSELFLVFLSKHKDQFCKLLKFEDQMCNFFQGLLLAFTDSSRACDDILELKYRKMLPGPRLSTLGPISCLFDWF